ncbi:protein kinase C-binding protein 1-like, partial [Stegodyphus dumicola]|uniref:protein kinase C-binding protein 1-like n=1 Tax=Stegodyphus dumicola TaxID=202533 RepID=UPI0015AE9428
MNNNFRNIQLFPSMPSKCWIPGCRSNYCPRFKARVFSFPRDEKLRATWLKAIQRKDRVPSRASKVCEKHFKPEDIITTASGFDSKTQVTITVPLRVHRLVPEAVPSLFLDGTPVRKKRVSVVTPEDNNKQVKEESEDSISAAGHSMQSKEPKCLESTDPPSEDNPDHVPEQTTEETSVIDKPKRNVRGTSTTDRPIITVIKAEDLKSDEPSPTKAMEECIEVSDTTPSNSVSSLPSPYKHLPSVTVCLKEEDRVAIPKEFGKAVKRSPSLGSNSSNGSSEAIKNSTPVPKRRKVEKPAPTVIGRKNDCYCWVCHRENIVLCCIACPRAYHHKCAGDVNEASSEWFCPECQRSLVADELGCRSSTLNDISLKDLCDLLKLSLNKMRQRAPVAFHQAVSLEHYPLYPHYIINPMDFSLLEKNIKQKKYGSTEAFLSDVKWILHNSCVFNGTQHPLSTNAKSMVKTCENDMQEIEVCPDCFMHSVVRRKYWFSEVCHKPHPLVWAKLKGFPYWPAKVVRIVDGNVDARFFGAHDRAWVPVTQCYHLSKEMPTTSKPKKKGNYEAALHELNVHVHSLIQKFGSFEYAPYRTSFDPQNKFFMYHGIDVDKVIKSDVNFDSNSPMKSSVKSPGCFGYSDSEGEKTSETRLGTDEYMDKSIKPLQMDTEECKDISVKPLQMDTEECKDTSVKPLQTEELSDPSSPVLKEPTAESDQSNTDKQQPASLSVLEINDENCALQDASKADDKIVSPKPKFQSQSDSDKLRKLELALERIKGYVSNNSDTDKETSGQEPVAENEQEPVANVESKPVDETEPVTKNGNTDLPKSVLSVISKAKPLPSLDLPTVIPEESPEISDIAILDAAKKNDSFSLKLHETIESCKAKLGISEIVEDDDTSDSESVEEEEEMENESLSEEEATEGTSSESEAESNSEMSDTDIENADVTEELETKETENIEDSNVDVHTSNICKDSHVHIEENNVEEIVVSAEVSDENSIKSTDPKLIDDNTSNENVTNTSKTKIYDISSSSEDETSNVKNTDFVEEKQCKNSVSEDIEKSFETSKNTGDNSSESVQTINSENSVCSISQLDSLIENSTVARLESKNIQKEKASNVLDIQEKAMEIEECNNMCDNVNNDAEAEKSSLSFDEKMENIKEGESPIVQPDNLDKHLVPNSDKMKEEDDDIFICNSPPTIKSPPPLICLDGTETEPEEKSEMGNESPHKSVENNKRTNVDLDQQGGTLKKLKLIKGFLNKDQVLEADKRLVLGEENARYALRRGERLLRKKRISSESSEESSEDEIHTTVPSFSRTPLTGAKRTFNNYDSKSNKNSACLDEDAFLNGEIIEQNNFSQEASQNSEADTQSLQEEVIKLKKKLNCLFTAFQIQHWKHVQEKNELRHNMNLIVMEMRANLEADKKQAVELACRRLEREKIRCIEETKKKQW